MLVVLKNWRNRVSDAEHSEGDRLLRAVELVLQEESGADFDDVLQQFHAALIGRRTLPKHKHKITALGSKFSDSTPLTAAENRHILNSTTNGFRHIDGGA